MSLLKELESLTTLYKNEIKQIEEFIDSIEKSIKRKTKRKPKAGFSNEEKKQIENFVEILSGLIEDKNDKKISIEASKNVSMLIGQIALSVKHKEFLYNMALSFLIAHQEAFIKDYIFQILLHRKSMLKSGNKISYEELLNFRSIKELTKNLAQREVDTLGYGSIDEINNYFEKKFNIALSKFERWELLREANYRRNIIIHNKGRTNQKYCEKTGYKIKNKSLTTSGQYVHDLADTLINFINFIHGAICLKLRLKI